MFCDCSRFLAFSLCHSWVCSLTAAYFLLSLCVIAGFCSETVTNFYLCVIAEFCFVTVADFFLCAIVWFCSVTVADFSLSLYVLAEFVL